MAEPETTDSLSPSATSSSSPPRIEQKEAGWKVAFKSIFWFIIGPVLILLLVRKLLLP